MRLADNPNLFANSPLARAAHHRRDADWLADAFASPQTRVTALWRTQPLMGREGGLADIGGLQRRALGDVPQVFLGLVGETPWFALDLSALAEADVALFGTLEEIRPAMAAMPPSEAAIIGQAKSMLDWHHRHRFCSNCGAESAMAEAGYKRHCAACGTDHFPRVDPVAIMLALHNDRCLVGRGAKFPPGMFSALAGFVEPGETGEEAAAREIYEEAGIKVDNVRYCFAQPWPFPSSLMMGFLCDAEDDEITLDKEEVVEARWLSRDEVRRLIAGEKREDLFIPPRFAIARQLLEVWVKDG